MKKLKKYSVILGLALAFLFLSACGKKDNDNDDKLLSKLESVKATVSQEKSTNNLTPENSATNVALNLDEQGVIITAELITNKKINNDENIFARITSDLRENRQSLHAASSAVCTDNKIIFPPIKTGLKRMKILVIAGGFAKSYSDYFDTCGGTNQTIQINLLEDVKLHGRAIRADGIPITNVYVRATPRGLYEKSHDIGHVDEKIETDADGNFVINKLLSENYKLNICADYFDYITTNINLYSDEENKYEFIFPKIKYRTLKGIAKYEKTDEPAEGIEIKCEIWQREGKTTISTIETDEKGGFKCQLPNCQFGSYLLTINEPGYAKVKRRLFDYKDESIILLLRETGIITGKITNEKGEPIPGVKPQFSPTYNYPNLMWKDAYGVRADTLSTEEGVYIVSNVAAPEVFKLARSWWGPNNYSMSDEYTEKEIKVNPDKVVTFDFKMLQEPKIKVKLIDENGNAILRYALHKEVKYYNSRSGRKKNVNLGNENDWCYLNVNMRKPKAKLSLTAQTEDEKTAVTNNIIIKTCGNYEIVLKIDAKRSPDAAGFIYNYDMSPVVDTYVNCSANSKYGQSQSDYLGFFELLGMDVKKGTALRLQIWKDNITYSTNVLAGNDDIEWILPKPQCITGKVFIEDFITPATNFAVSIWGRHGKKKFCSNDGKFSLPLDSPLSKELFKVYIFVNGYAPEEREINPNDINTLELGDIIVMNKSATISGKVVDQNNNPICANLYVNIKEETPPVLNTKSKESDGSFEFTDVNPGIYYINAYHGYNFVKSKPFEITAEDNFVVPDLVIKVPSNLVEISGTAFLDDAPLNYAKLIFSPRKIYEEVKLISGKFKVKIVPGEYAVSCLEKKVITTVNLKESNDNEINFKSGSGIFDFELPFENNWEISLNRRVDNISPRIAFIRIYSDKLKKVDKIQDGEYNIAAFCWDEKNRTNITVNATIKSGETKKIRF